MSMERHFFRWKAQPEYVDHPTHGTVPASPEYFLIYTGDSPEFAKIGKALAKKHKSHWEYGYLVRNGVKVTGYGFRVEAGSKEQRDIFEQLRMDESFEVKTPRKSRSDIGTTRKPKKESDVCSTK